MAVQVNPITQSLPATTAIQDPAVRRFAQAVEDALRASNSPEGSVKALVEALEAVGKGSQVSPVFGLNGTPQGVSEIYKSRLYDALKSPVAQIVQREGLGSAEALEVIEDNNTVIVNALNAMWATVGASGVFTEDGKNIVANWTTVQAEKWSQIEAEVLSAGGQTIRAALAEEAQVRANLEGDVYASYTLRVDANGNIAGFGLAADENSSEFIVRADKFAVVTDIGGTPHVPFAIGPSGAEFTGLTSWGNVQGKTGFAALDGKITPSNVTTYIDNAAIGNAQIGGDIWSSNYVYNVSGWYLQRNGSLYCANAYVRGNVEASSLKANTLMVNRANIVNAAVDTLQIEGNAVTIPVHSRPGSVNLAPSTWTNIATAWIDAGGSTVSIFASASIKTATSESAQNIYIRVLSPSGAQIGKNSISVRDGLYSPASLITSSAEAGTYTLQVWKPGLSTLIWVEDISLFLIGTKR